MMRRAVGFDRLGDGAQMPFENRRQQGVLLGKY
jgi:hypothetical protein